MADGADGGDGDDGHVHRPAAGRGDREFGARGWLLVAAIVAAFLVVPGLIYASRSIGLPFTVAYLVLPLVPAVALAALAVWVTASS